MVSLSHSVSFPVRGEPLTASWVSSPVRLTPHRHVSGFPVRLTPYRLLHGMDRYTGKRLIGLEHLRQSLIDILTTRIGLRVMLRDYGGSIPSLIDQPLNQFFAVDLYVAIADACAKWEPRLRLEQIFFKNLGDGRVEVDLEAIYLPQGKAIKMQGLVIR